MSLRPLFVPGLLVTLFPAHGSCRPRLSRDDGIAWAGEKPPRGKRREAGLRNQRPSPFNPHRLRHYHRAYFGLPGRSRSSITVHERLTDLCIREASEHPRLTDKKARAAFAQRHFFPHFPTQPSNCFPGLFVPQGLCSRQSLYPRRPQRPSTNPARATPSAKRPPRPPCLRPHPSSNRRARCTAKWSSSARGQQATQPPSTPPART